MLTRYMLNIFLVFVMFSFSACNSAKVKVVKKREIASWVNQIPPNDNDKFIYGIGIASDRKTAINTALSDMIAKLGTTIESSHESYEEFNDTYAKSTFSSHIKSSISKIKINNYKILKASKISYREFAVMIETDKVKLGRGLLQNLKNRKMEIQNSLNSTKNTNILNSYKIKKELYNDVLELTPLVLIISELNSSFDIEKNLKFIQKIKKEFLDQKRELKFFIYGDKNSLVFVDAIKNRLAKLSFNVSKSSKNAVIVKIKTKQNLSNFASNAIVTLNINLSILEKLKRLGGKSIILKEMFNGSYNSVYRNASIHFNQDIKNQNIDELLGINLLTNH